MTDQPPRTKEPRRPTRRTELRPWSPIRDDRIAAAFDRGDTDNIFFVEFVLAYRSDAGARARIADITADPQHMYEIVVEGVPEKGRAEYKWFTNTGEPEFERIFMPAPG
jgi:hypothetical protein